MPSGSSAGRLNVSYNCLDRHLDTPVGQQGGADLGGRTGRAGHARRGTHLHLQAAPSRGLPLRQCPQAQRPQERRPRHHLSADGAGGRHRHAGLRAHRRGAFGCLRRLQRAIGRRPHFRLPGQSWSSRPTAASAAAASCRLKKSVDEALDAQGRRAAICWPRRSRRSSCCAAPTTKSTSRKGATSGGIARWSTSTRIARRRSWTAKRRSLYFTPAARPANPRASCTPPPVICSAPS